MSKSLKSGLLKYGICITICLLIAIFLLSGSDFFNLELQEKYRVLCDAFSVPGMLCLFGGLLVWVGNEGAFDGIGYVLSYAFHAVLPGNLNKRESYKEYLERKKDDRTTGYGFVFVVGIIFMVLSLLFLGMFHLR